MKKSLKVLSILLTICLTFTIMSISVFAATSVRISSSSLSLRVDQERKLSATVSPSTDDQTVTWSSSNSSIADVYYDGTVRGIAKGTVYIYAYASDGTQASCIVYVDGDYGSNMRVVMNPSTKTLRVGQEFIILTEVFPDVADQYVTWSSSDDLVAEVDSDGTVKAIAPGTASIRAKSYSGASGYCEITVPGKALNDNIADGDSTSTTTPVVKTPSVVTGVGEISSATVVDALKKATDGKVTFKNIESISGATIKAAAKANAKAVLNFDTKADNGSTTGRLTITADAGKAVSGKINVGVYTTADQVGKVQTKFEDKFRNDLAVVKLAQSGSYGFTVRVAAKTNVDSIKSDSLVFYTYNTSTGKYAKIEKPAYTVGSNGFVYFNVTSGGYVVITDSALKAR